MTDEPEGPQPTQLRIATSNPNQRTAPAGSLEKPTGESFAAQMSSTFLFNHEHGKWLHWTGSRWEPDKVAAHLHEMGEFTNRRREMDQRQTKLASLSFNRNALAFAAASPDMRRKASDFDNDPMLIGTPNGYVDLTTGKHHKPNPSKMISKVTGVAPMSSANCPRWTGFIDWAFDGDEETISYLQKFLGYCLTGMMNEEIVTFVYGPGGNGKGVMLYTLGQILGDYYISTPSSTFMSKRNQEHATELARLDGARLVSASETNEDDKWDAGRIKEISGNENPISARFMRQDFFDFWPVCKLLIIGNSKPAFDDVDAAITRRLRMVEMKQKPTKVDKTLKESLAEEHPAILRWLIDGCIAWQKEGLAPPDSITKASNAYLRSQDVIKDFLDEWFMIDLAKEEWFTSRAEIRDAIAAFSSINGMTRKTPATRVYKRLVEVHSFPDNGTLHGVRGFKGLIFKPEAYAQFSKWRKLREKAGQSSSSTHPKGSS